MTHYTIPSSGKASHILDTAERLFGAHGFEGLSMSALANEAGVSKANIFHHFGSKEELYMTVLHRARKRFVSQLLTLTVSHAEPQQRIHALTHAYLRQMLENEPLVRLLMRELMEKRRPGKLLSERLFADNFSELVGLLREAQSRGELHADFDPGMAMLIIAAVSILYIQGSDFLRHLPSMSWLENPDLISDALWNILWHGIAPRSPIDNTNGIQS
ncbi:MAG TPA: TetR/AcrR family transcriptional regulator [Gammaproteobacteria bacterium]